MNEASSVSDDRRDRSDEHGNEVSSVSDDDRRNRSDGHLIGDGNEVSSVSDTV